MALSAVQEETLTKSFGPVSEDHLRRFEQATLTTRRDTPPLTFPTVYRATEFQWLDRLNIDMHRLLHTDQEYEYVEPLKEGDCPVVSTRIRDYRERRGMLFVTLESEIRANGVLKIRSYSAFVVRNEPEAL